MTHIERTIEISAEPATVWSIVSELEQVSEWNPGVTSATCPANARGSVGLGTARRCDLAQGGSIDEVVTQWVEGREIGVAIGSHGGIRSADMGMTLVPSVAGTRVVAGADYHLAYGPLGPVIDRIVVKRSMGRMLEVGLAGLKEHIESTPVGPADKQGRVIT